MLLTFSKVKLASINTFLKGKREFCWSDFSTLKTKILKSKTPLKLETTWLLLHLVENTMSFMIPLVHDACIFIVG